MIGASCCERCGGRGRIFAYARAEPCPVCGGAGPRSKQVQIDQAHALDGLAHCWRNFELGQTSDFNLGLAARRAFSTGLTIEQLHKRAGVPMRVLRRLEGGQLTL